VAWWRGRRPEDFDEEILAHVEAEEARLRDRGVAPDEARRRARVAFGGITQAREGFRERSRWRWFETLWHDTRYGARLMRRSPAFTITAVVVLGLGIGVNAALFSVINGLFFRDLHVRQPERLVYLQTRSPSPSGRVLGSVSQEDAQVLRDAAGAFADFTAHGNTVANVTIDEVTSVLNGEFVEANYFDLLGVTCERGRPFRAEDNEPSNPDLSVIVSHDVWTKRLSGDPEAIGRSVRINGLVFRVIGVAPEGFQGLASAFRPSAWWIPNKQVGGGRWQSLGPIARLKPGVDLAGLAALVAARTPDLVRRQWDEMRGSTNVWPWEVYRHKAFPLAKIADVDIPSNPEARLVSPAVLAAVATVSGLVLVIACANIAGLLLARGRSRTGEVAVRQALGAAGFRLFRQIATESLLLSASGALVGLAVAVALVRLFTAVTPETLSVPISIDARVLTFAVLAALATGTIVGLTPALQATRVQLVQALGSGVIGSRGAGHSLARWIVVPQVTVSLVLLIVAAVHVRALRHVEVRHPGYRTSGITVVEFGRGQMDLDRWTQGMIRVNPSDAARGRAFVRNVVSATAAAAGVDQVAVVSRLPVAAPLGGEKPVVERGPSRAAQPAPISAVEVFVSDGYFDLMDMHPIAGRTFDERDRQYEGAGPHVAVVSESIARVLGGAGLVGRSISLPADSGGEPHRLDVVGIVNDVEPVLNDGRVHPVVYEVLGQETFPGGGNLLVRGHGDRTEQMASVRKAILGADASAEITRVRTLDDIVGEILYPRRLAAGILAAAAVIALALACIGLYGIVSYTAAERTREFGIRATLGATREDIVRLVLRDGAITLGAGISFGLVFGAIALRAASSVVRGLPTFDAAVFVVVPVVLVLVVLVACLSPALRAARIDPAQVIRGE